MQFIINYFVESSVSLGVLTVFYMLVLQNTRQLQFKRWYLLASLVFASLLPLGNFSLVADKAQPEVPTTTAYYMLETFTVTAGEMTNITMPVVEQHHWIGWVYWIGFALLIVRLVMGLVRIGLMKNLFSSTDSNTFRLFITEGSYHPFSFFRWVFIPKPLWENGSGKVILEHEKQHSQQWHSMDILLLELVLIVQWFNPFAWVIRKAIKDNHEFLADRAVLDSGVSRTDYFKSMLFPVMGARFDMANNFNVSITKKRIKMMKSNDIKKHTGLFVSMSLVLVTALFMMFACETDELIKEYANTETAFVLNGQLVLPQDVLKSDETTTDKDLVRVTIDGEEHFINPDLSANLSYAKVMTVAEAKNMYADLDLPKSITQVVMVGEKSSTDSQVFLVVEEMPAFPGGKDSLMKYLGETVRYPALAQENGIQGRVFVGFVIDKTGLVRDVKLTRGVDSILDVEAMRVVRGMPNWTPGYQRGKAVNVSYTLPINFVLQGKQEAGSTAGFGMELKDGEVHLQISGTTEIKTVSIADAKEYIKDHPGAHVTLHSKDKNEPIQEFISSLKAEVAGNVIIRTNSGSFGVTTKDLNKFSTYKQELEELTAGKEGMDFSTREGKNGEFILHVTSSGKFVSDPSLVNYFSNVGGYIMYWSVIEIQEPGPSSANTVDEITEVTQ